MSQKSKIVISLCNLLIGSILDIFVFLTDSYKKLVYNKILKVINNRQYNDEKIGCIIFFVKRLNIIHI